MAGHYAFATLAEIVALLEADPQTDWRTVDLESLRQHLIDMDRVTLSSTVESSPLDTGMRFSVTSTDPATIASIQRMTRAHARMQNTAADAAANPAAGDDDAGNTITPFWRYTVQGLDNGVVMTVSTDDASSIQRMRGLGFIGILVSGMHHQAHHWSMAKGANPHTH